MNGMAGNEDESYFDDDDFDDLNDSTLQELEHNAVVSTQQAPAQKAAPPVPRPLPGQVSGIRPIMQAQPGLRPSQALHPRVRNVFAEFQDELDNDSFEFLGDERVPTPVEEVQSFIPPPKIPGEMTQREQWRTERFSKPNPHVRQPSPQKRRHHLSPYQPPASNTGPYNGVQLQEASQESRTVRPAAIGNRSGEHEALQAQIEELRRERDQLTKDLDEKQREVWAKQGEVSVLREKKDTDSKVFDRQLSALKRSMQEEASKHRTALEALTAKNRQADEQYQMLKHDLDEEVYRTRTLQAKLKSNASEKKIDLAATPERRQEHSFRDGFDGDEVMAISPVKSNKKSKPPTPQAAGKRKRKVDGQSPIKPLALRQTSATSHSQSEQLKADRIIPIYRTDERAQRHLKLIQRVLNYQLRHTEEPLVEHLMKYSFPVDPKKSFSSIVLEASSQLTGPRLPTDLLEVFTNPWSRCIKEKYHDPILTLLETTNYILDLDLTLLDKAFLSSFLPTLEASVTINGFTRFSHSPVYHANLGQFKPTPQSALSAAVPTTPILRLLYKLASVAAAPTLPSSPSHNLIDHLWRLLTTDFILLLLNPWQPLADMTLVFSILATSINPATFGNICSDPAQQSKMESYIVERICHLLWETPRVDEGLQPPTRAEILNFRLAATDLLLQLGYHPGKVDHHGTLLLFHHQSAIARLTRSLYDSVAGLYSSPFNETTVPLHARMINTTTMLLHHLIYVLPQSTQSSSQNNENAGDSNTSITEPITLDLQQKLGAVNGGAHKFTIVLTRLAFSEGFVIDEGITDETVVMATQMLEEAVTPDEAEMLVDVVAGKGWENRRRRNTVTQSGDRPEED